MFSASGIRLGKRELEIMNVVWQLGEATVQEVCDRLERSAAYSTVITMMRTLEAKGMLSHKAVGRTFVYRARVPRDHVRTSVLRELRDLLFGGSPAILLHTMLSGTPMRAEELAELRAILKQAESDGTTNA
jgi:predicted transcriptional regulator